MSQEEEQHSPSRGVAAEVQDFYERYPYPRPIDSLEKYQRLWQDRQRRRADYHLFWPANSFRESYSILVAGCGTSQAAKHAMRWPEASVTGIDFSTTSVRCTEELKGKYQLNNLSVRQLAIERVGELAASFDQIVCTGVLHHLPGPRCRTQSFARCAQTGWRDPSHGVCAVRTDRHLYAAGVLPSARHSCRRCRAPGSDRGAHCVAARTSAGNPAARGPGLPAGGGACRCAAAPAGSRLFGAATIRISR